MIILAYPYFPLPEPLKCDTSKITTIGHDYRVQGWPNPIESVDIDDDAKPTASSKAVLIAESDLAVLARQGDLVIHFSEEGLPVVAKVAGLLGCVGIPRQAAWCCLDRKSQRTTLDNTTYNVRWDVEAVPKNLDPPYVIKAPISVLNQGTEICENPATILAAASHVRHRPFFWRHRVELLYGAFDYTYLVEEYATGTMYEVDGISGADGIVRTFRPIRQIWDWANMKIVGYEVEQEHKDELIEVAHTAVEALGIRWSGWCVEIKGPPWKVIEVNGRLGFDWPKYKFFETISPDRHPWPLLVETLVAEYEKRQ